MIASVTHLDPLSNLDTPGAAGMRLIRHTLLLITELQERGMIKSGWGEHKLTPSGRQTAEAARSAGYAPPMGEVLECIHWMLEHGYIARDTLTDLGWDVVAAHSGSLG